MTVRTKRTIGAVTIVLALAALAYWGLNSHQLWTTTQTPVEVTDELFGTKSITWKPELTIGLEYTAAVAGPLFLIGIVMLWSARRQQKRGG